MKLTGLFIEYENKKGIVFLFDCRGILRYGAINNDGLGFKCHGHVTREMTFGKTARFRLLIKNSLVELYLDDVLMQSYNLTKPSAGIVGIIPGDREDILSKVEAWEFSVK